MMRLLKIPKVQMFLCLLLIFLTGIFNYKTPLFFQNFVLALGFTVVFDFLFLRMRGIKPFPPYAALVAGSIIGLIASPSFAWYQLAAAAGMAMASKNFIRINKAHIFNPAAFGIFASHFIFGQSVSWIGVGFQQAALPLLILFLPAYVAGYKMRRWVSIVGFFVVYALLAKTSLSNLLNPTVIFFALVMVPEPMTTPVIKERQLFFGVTVALLSFGLARLSGLLDVFTTALLIANVLFFRFK